MRESRPGVLGGLHMLRSDALVTASHDETVFLTAETLWQSLPATTNETLPRVVQSMFADSRSADEPQLLRNLADLLGNSSDIGPVDCDIDRLGAGDARPARCFIHDHT